DVPGQCLACHDGEDAVFKAKHLQLSGSQIDCRKCHDPHGSADAGLTLSVAHDPFTGGACDVCHEKAPDTTRPEGKR
ncbi:MAG: hypothetical protein PHR28_13980, partial [candidate division Zixibacteria bacterium]|nr:hypothetical protein [candidate division Zixibacteria bacterium]